MKLFFVIALLCASVISFAQDLPMHDFRKVTQCGFTSQAEAIHVAATSIIVNSDETVTGVHLEPQTSAGSLWCITLTITCNSIAVTKTEQVPDVSKVIKSQECDLKQLSTFTEF
jgi:hypothetical protein